MPIDFRFRWLVLPVIFLIALAGWSAYWFYTHARVQDEVEREVAHLQARGGDFACRERRWQGFPLRIALICGRATLALPGGAVIETAGLEAAGYLHNLRYIVIVADGPSRIRFDTGDILTVDHTAARIALAVPDEGLPEVSLAAERVAAEGDSPWSFRGRNIFIEARSDDPDRLGFSAGGEALRLAVDDAPAINLEALEVEGWVEGLPAALPDDLVALLREAARLGSRLIVETFKARMGSIQMTASGTVELGPEGPTGTLNTTVSDYREFLADLERRGVISKRAVRASTAVIGLLQGRRTRAEGEVRVALRFHEGQVFWGPFAVAEIPPLP